MTQDNKCSGCPDGHADYEGICLPQVDFITFAYSMASAAMVHLGEMPDPDTGGSSLNKPLAKHTIDTLSMLEEKTRGNLTPEESSQLTQMLGHLKMLYVRKAG